MMYFTIVIIICPVDFCVAAVLRPEPSRSDMITRTWPASSLGLPGHANNSDLGCFVSILNRLVFWKLRSN